MTSLEDNLRGGIIKGDMGEKESGIRWLRNHLNADMKAIRSQFAGEPVDIRVDIDKYTDAEIRLAIWQEYERRKA